jgi:putative oxidoreductase
MFRRLLAASAPASTVLVRLLVGSVFLSEGIQTFLYPAELGAGRLQKSVFLLRKSWGRSFGGAKLSVALC